MKQEHNAYQLYLHCLMVSGNDLNSLSVGLRMGKNEGNYKPYFTALLWGLKAHKCYCCCFVDNRGPVSNHYSLIRSHQAQSKLLIGGEITRDYFTRGPSDCSQNKQQMKSHYSDRHPLSWNLHNHYTLDIIRVFKIHVDLLVHSYLLLIIHLFVTSHQHNLLEVK